MSGPSRHLYRQHGSTLIEALIAMAIFAISILALIALQGFTIRANSENQYRGQATYLANSLIGQMWAARASGSFATNFAFNSGSTCNGTSTSSSQAEVSSWLSSINSTLPNANAARQSVTITSALGGAANQVTITICWQNTSDGDVRRFTTTTLIPTT
ncbi:type IV pilus modification protein PilV [Pseudogulbenkiania sp. MAI-1]|uniref:type IV pilus modification protein PilV n=1 Tax=Pseudogulbenkiania sp. MAI-1 TaxID=990370 RepID=UPI00045E5CCC|nr:type IV pilus modification protein PilV [Pseudogulbenkiania sp. MAI-1]